MAKRRAGLTNNQILLILTIPITIGSVVTIMSFLLTTGVVGNLQGEFQSLSDQVQQQQSLDSQFLAQLPINDPAPAVSNQTEVIFEEPDGFRATDQDLISAFLDAIGIRVTETFDIRADVTLIDANFAEQIASSQVKVQPLDPRSVIVEPPPEFDNARFFINTDFSRQIADNGVNHHKFSGWNIVQDFGGASAIPVVVTTTTNCAGIVDNTGLCVQVIGSKNNDDDTRNGSVLHGLSKVISLADWTGEGDLIVSLDYDCNRGFYRGFTQVKITLVGDEVGLIDQFTTPTCNGFAKYTKEISELVGNSNTITFQFGTFTGSVDKFRMDYKFNNAQLLGNSRIIRQAQEVIQQIPQASIIQSNEQGTILDLGIIQTNLIGKTLFPNERVVLTGDFETRIGSSGTSGVPSGAKTISQHQLTANGITDGAGEIIIKIDGQDSFFFTLDEQFYDANSFQKLTFVVNNMIVNVGEGDELRTFEYHTPFVTYLLEFNVRPDEIIAFNEKDVAISVLKNDSTLITCGTSAGDINAEVLPPIVAVNSNGFTIAITNPISGKGAITDPITKEVQEDAEFCQTVPNLPRDTEITFKIENSFFEVFSPIIQSNYFVKCTPNGCSSNIGYSVP